LVNVTFKKSKPDGVYFIMSVISGLVMYFVLYNLMGIPFKYSIRISILCFVHIRIVTLILNSLLDYYVKDEEINNYE